MIQTIAMLMIAIAIVGAIGKAELLVQHANADFCGTGTPTGTCSSPGQGADVFKGFVCSIGPAGTTTESHKVFTASGGAHLTCHAYRSARFMYKMNTRMLLAIVSTTAVFTMMTSSIGVGIFSQHANAAPGNGNPTQSATQVKGAQCTIIGGPMFGGNPTVVTHEMHAVITSSGQVNLNCHS